MPEATLDTAPAAAQPVGIDKMLAQLDTAILNDNPEAAKPASAQPAPAEPEAKPVQVTQAATAVTQAAPAKPAPAQAAEAEPDWTKAPPKWHKIYESFKGKTSEQIKSLETKIRSLETKPFSQAGDDQKLAVYEKQLEELKGKLTEKEQRLAKLDYSSSEEFQSKFVNKAVSVYQEAVSLVGQLTVRDGDNERPATKDDFDLLRKQAIGPRIKAAKAMFGDYAQEVLGYARNLDDIQRESDNAKKQHAENLDKERLEQETTSKKQKAQYESAYQQSLKQMQENPNWGKWFKPDEADPEGSKLLQDRFDEIESITQSLPTLSIDEQAAYTAMWRGQIAAFPRLLTDRNRLEAQVKALNEKLAKLQGTDPGVQPKGGLAPAGGEGKKGWSTAMAELEALDNLR